MAGDVEFMRELQVYLDGLDWVTVTYARIADGGAVDLGVETDHAGRLHVGLVERFGAGRVNVAAQPARVAAARATPDEPDAPADAGAEPVEPTRLVDGWSVDPSGRELTLHYVGGAADLEPELSIDETPASVAFRLVIPKRPGTFGASGESRTVSAQLAAPLAARSVINGADGTAVPRERPRDREFD